MISQRDVYYALKNTFCKQEECNRVIIALGKVLGIYIDDNYIIDGLFDASKARPLVRLGYMNYGVVGEENTFTKNRPELDENGNLKEVKEWDGVYR